MTTSQKSLVVSLLMITVGVGWLLMARGVAPQVNWVWTLGLAVCGVLVFATNGFDKFSLVVGMFFLVGSLISLLRQQSLLLVQAEAPILVIVAGTLLLLARSKRVPMPEWFVSVPADESPKRSAAQPNPAERVQEARERITTLAKEILAESQSTGHIDAVALGILWRTADAVGARGGVIWSLLPNGEVNAVYSVGIAQSDPAIVTNPDHVRIVKDFLQSWDDEAAIAPEESLGEGLMNSTDCLLLLCRFGAPKFPIGAVELLQRRETPVQARPGFQQFLRQMTSYLARSRALSDDPPDMGPRWTGR